MADIIIHPLASGFLDTLNIGLYLVPTAQRIQLSCFAIHNESAVDVIVYAAILVNGKTIKLTPGSGNFTLKAGYKAELIHEENKFFIDQGAMILGYAGSTDKVSFIVDGKVILAV